MPVVTIVRQPSTDSGTFGQLTVEGSDFSCVTLELPWLGDQANISCIPVGSYMCDWKWSQSHGRDVYHVEGVPDGRTNVEMHSANIIAQLRGCIALGQEQAIFPADTFEGIEVATKGVQHSKATVASFEQLMNQTSFTLVISNE